MKRSLFSILAVCVITVGLAGCGGDETEIPDGHTADDVRPQQEAVPVTGTEDATTFKGD